MEDIRVLSDVAVLGELLPFTENVDPELTQGKVRVWGMVQFGSSVTTSVLSVSLL